MKFTTPVPVPKSPFLIDHSSKILLLGSCFSENIGHQFKYYKFPVTVNPFGIIFNPVSLQNIIQRTVNQNPFTETDILYHQNQYVCLQTHSQCNGSEIATTLAHLNNIQQQLYQSLSQAHVISITLGTAWVYQWKATGTTVANCHKIPQTQFTKYLLTIEEITEALNQLTQSVKYINPQAKWIFTISPVRHLKDGFVENQISKAHLIAGLHHFLKTTPLTAYYFPSYEILMDELRDYRFYEPDMLHPNSVAIQYIWQQFTQTFMNNATHTLLNKVDSYQRLQAHRPLQPQSLPKHQEQLELKKTELKHLMPHITWE